MKTSKYMISDTQYLQINLECINDDECKICAQIDIDYIDEEKNICIKFGNEALSDFCYKILESGFIKKLINGEMTIDSSITDDLGFECNQYFNGIKKKSIVINYLFGSNDHKQIRPYFNSWMYNDKDGNVIFEITPFYPWHYETKKSCPEKISYKKWIKDYKPVIKTIVPKENLKKWIKQATMLNKMLQCDEDQCS